MDTLEVRWFADGRAPSAILELFTRSGDLGYFEDRVDRYVLNGEPDVGIKYRDLRVLESKQLYSVDGILTTSWAPPAPFESWTKCEIEASPRGVLVDVRKQVATRTFMAVPAGGVPARCEVEVASISFRDHRHWTVAFEASGDPRRREAMIRWSLDQVSAAGPILDLLDGALRQAASYPEWLARCVGLPLSSHAVTASTHAC